MNYEKYGTKVDELNNFRINRHSNLDLLACHVALSLREFNDNDFAPDITVNKLSINNKVATSIVTYLNKYKFDSLN